MVDGFHRPRLSGGVVELVRSLDGVRFLDLQLVEELLEAMDHRTLFGAVGWFLERHRDPLFVPDNLLQRLASWVPASPHYLEPMRGRSKLMARWNVLVPLELAEAEAVGSVD
ncbi:MAG: hypothetical protein K8H99_07830 [Nitrospirae bacterium]|nr:hypothetical protein [Fimbriimonadaceae bacterium]